MALIQLPSGVISKGYKRSERNRFEFDQVFYSPEHNFTGTEEDFIKEGLAYEYIEIDKSTHRIIRGVCLPPQRH